MQLTKCACCRTGIWWRTESGVAYVPESSTLRSLHRELIRDQPPGRGVEALIIPACYQLSAELGILLDARTCPARIIATHHESRTPAITHFQLRGSLQLSAAYAGLRCGRVGTLGDEAHSCGPLPAAAAAADLADVMTATQESHAGGDAEGRVRSGSS